MASYDEVMAALRNAHNAGDVKAAQRFAAMAANLKKSESTPAPVETKATSVQTPGGFEQKSIESLGLQKPPAGFDVSSPEAIQKEIQTKIKPFTADWYKNQAKIGLTQSSALLSSLVETAYLDPLSNISTNITALVEDKEGVPAVKFKENFFNNLAENIEIAQGITGADFSQARSDDLLENTIGTAIQVASDPLTYIPGAGPVLKSMSIPIISKSLAQRAALNTVVGATSELGGELGDTIEKETTGESTGTGRLIGSIFGVAKSTLITTPSAYVINKGGKFIYDKYKNIKAAPGKNKEAQTVGAAKALLKAAAAEEGLENLDLVLKNFNIISDKINKQNAPLLVALAENPAIRKQVERLAKTNPDFRNKINQELNLISLNIDAHADKIFGARYTELPKGDLVNLSNARDRINLIDSRLNKLTNPFEAAASKEGTGNVISALITKKADAVRQDISPRYNTLIEAATAEKVVLPSQGTKLIYDFVNQNRLRDIFGKETKIDKLIMKHFSPKGTQYPTVTFSNVDSLKRAINDLQRKPLNATEKRLLNDLEDKVNDARQLIPGKWNDELKALDMEYYERLGVPFNAQGIKDIDAKKYAEQVAPVITKNSSALKQFLDVTGDEGVDVARNAIMSDAYFKVIKNGDVDIRALDRYIQNNAEVIDKIPGLKQSLLDTKIDGASLKLKKFNLGQEVKLKEKEIADNFLNKLEGAEPNYSEITSRILKDRNYFKTISQDLKNSSPEVSKAVLNNMRRELIEIARTSPEGAYNFLTNPKNAFGINQLMGSGYQQKVKELALMSDAIKKADVSRLSDAIATNRMDTLAQVIPGADSSYVFSQLRDRISSVPMRIFRLGSRIFSERMGMATDEQLAQLLLDPDGITKLTNVAKDLDITLTNPLKAKELVDAFSDILPYKVYVSTRPGQEMVISEEEEPSLDFPKEPGIKLGTFY